MRLSYKHPAKCWEETIPVGNGKLGGMIWGTVAEEKIGLNDENLWSGYQRDKNRENSGEHLEEIRKKIFSGEYREAGRDVERHVLGEFTESYLPLGDLLIRHQNGLEDCTDYERELSLEHAAAAVSYEQGGVKYTRKVFASYPAKAMVIIWEADKKAMNLEIAMDSQLLHENSADKNCLIMRGQCPEHVDPSYLDSANPVIQGDKGMYFQAECQVTECDGEITAQKESLEIHNASRMVLVYRSLVGEELENAQQVSYPDCAVLEQEHLADYKALFDRVELFLGEDVELPTDERLERLKNGEEDPALFALYYQYGRYLLISSSRGDGMPANLQGIWNWKLRAPWSSNYTTNINAEMNYWPALSSALPECLESYFSFIERIIPNGEKTAKETFGCRGFCINHNTDFWGVTNPVGKPYGASEGNVDSVGYSFFPVAGLWMCQEYFRYYEYTGDVNFLKERVYPVLRKAALFAVDWLVEHDGVYVTCPSTSPENQFIAPNGERAYCSYGGTMDMTLIREVFHDFRKTCELLGEDDELLQEIAAKESALLPYQTGSEGQLLEWCQDFEESELGHRHVSHLYGLFPSEIFESMPEWKEPVRKSLERRLAHGGGHTGWSCGWIINLFAVLRDGEKAYEYLKVMLKRSTYPNLWDAHPPFQIDGNFAGTAGIANMLVQDRGGELTLLPAIPKEWKNGHVKGLRVKGNKAVDIRWENGEIAESRIYEVTE